jgi:hypothetical protein
MQALRQRFLCARYIVLGALYDTVERLRWKLVSANSDAGILMTTQPRTGLPFLIRVDWEQAGQTVVTVELASGACSDRDSPGESAALLLETLAQIVAEAISGERPNI